MNFPYTELLNIFLLLFLSVDYYRKYGKKMDKNSDLWFLECLSIFLLSVISIFIFLIKDIYFQNILLTVQYILVAVFILIHSEYIDENYISKNRNKGVYIFFAVYTFITIIMFMMSPLRGEYVNSLVEYDKFYIFLGLINVPLLYLIGKILFIKLNVEMRIYFALLLPLTGSVLSYIFKEESFLTFSYSLSLLLLYMFKYDSVINKDVLTGANNRRFFDNYVYSSDKRYAVYMIDMDDFKKVNDTYGHDEGDVVLIDLVEVLKSSVRTTDSVIRLGGDEFVIIAALKNDNDIKIIYNRINSNIKKYNDIHKIPLKLSIGYGLYSSDMNFRDFLNIIDKKMYKKKTNRKKNNEKKNKNNI